MIKENKAREQLVVDGMNVEVERIPAFAMVLFANGFTDYIWADGHFQTLHLGRRFV
jgi:hypothetical protein